MRALCFAISLAGLASACQTTSAPSAPPEQTSNCPVIDARNWSAHINAMPGPNAQRTLIVTGEVDLPTPGYAVTLTAGAADRSAIPVQQIIVSATRPTGIVPQIVTTFSARYDGPAIAQHYRAVRVMCGAQQLAELDVTVAH
ncbi:hypothetical protein [Candidatus Viadribacter manganicus]|uniref:Lipoprotein n=1 Tax=Candidatus Viadribacter manganicus TaxID=1759059 RepID=A0A1B1AM65_9PROT|nr:hypothetical protein [Candidatus Viadribacter manganicus]ANP47662.1 hypothetical protein ATE48_18025 [Candidatus Viadribacter manganicus]